MINHIDSTCSFKGDLKTTAIKISNKNRLKNIKNLYANLTKNYSKPLYVTPTENGGMSFHVSNVKNGDFYEGSEIFTSSSFKDYMNKMSDNDIAEKCAAFFNVIHLSDKARELFHLIKERELKCRHFMGLANSCRLSGNVEFANRYDFIAKLNKDKLNSLKENYNTVKEQFNYQKSKNIENNSEINQIKLEEYP